MEIDDGAHRLLLLLLEFGDGFELQLQIVLVSPALARLKRQHP